MFHHGQMSSTSLSELQLRLQGRSLQLWGVIIMPQRLLESFKNFRVWESATIVKWKILSLINNHFPTTSSWTYWKGFGIFSDLTLSSVLSREPFDLWITNSRKQNHCDYVTISLFRKSRSNYIQSALLNTAERYKWWIL